MTAQLNAICERLAAELGLGSQARWTQGQSYRYPYSDIQYLEFPTSPRPVSVVVKTFHDRVVQDRLVSGEARAERTFRALQHVWQHMPSGSGFTAPQPLACLGPSLAMERATGNSVEGLWKTDPQELETAYCSLGTWLDRFSMIPCPSASDPREAFDFERDRVATNLAFCASEGAISIAQRRSLDARVEELARAIEPALPALQVPLCHGDFIPLNIFHGPGLTTAIDFETMRPGFWPRDVVSILANLTVRCALNPTRRSLVRRCSRAFLDARGVPAAAVAEELFQFFLAREFTAQLRTRLECSYASFRERLAAHYVRRMLLFLLLHPRHQWGCN